MAKVGTVIKVIKDSKWFKIGEYVKIIRIPDNTSYYVQKKVGNSIDQQLVWFIDRTDVTFPLKEILEKL